MKELLHTEDLFIKDHLDKIWQKHDLDNDGYLERYEAAGFV